MEKSLTDKQNDIATEPYKGPGRIITSAGYMYVSHAAMMIAGLIGVGALGAIFHQRTNAIKQWAETLSESHSESAGVKKFLAGGVAFVSKNAEKAAHTIVGWWKKISGNRFQGKMGEERTTAFLFAGGFGAITGYIGSSIWGIAKGSHEGNAGKHQFEHAQAEIHALREKNQDLKKVNENLRQEYVAAASRLKDEEGKDKAAESTEAPKEKPVTKQEARTAEAPATAKLEAAEHQGKLAAEHAAEPAMA